MICEWPTWNHLRAQACRKTILKSVPEISISNKSRNLVRSRTIAKGKIGRQQKNTEGQTQYEDQHLLAYHHLTTRDPLIYNPKGHILTFKTLAFLH